METPSFLSSVARAAASFEPPTWVTDEAVNRLLLWLNHVLQQEPQATARLQRWQGQRIEGCWQQWRLAVCITPAGLLDRVDAANSIPPDLCLTLQEDTPLAVVQALWQGHKPKVHIAGDVRLAAEVNWLIDHVRWDVQDDLARCMGEGPAQLLVQTAQGLVRAVRAFVGRPAHTPAAAPAQTAP